MKLWEVIKALTEDPTKKFERKDRYKHWVIGTDVVGGAISGETYYFMLDCDGEGTYGDAGKFSGNLANNEDDWQEVKQPVTWQEAIQAWADGKKVSYKYSYNEMMHVFQDSNRMLSIEKIEDAVWYVED